MREALNWKEVENSSGEIEIPDSVSKAVPYLQLRRT